MLLKNQFIGFNTDGVGALNAIEKITQVKNKKIVILGAGGTAKAIVYEALRRGAEVIVLNKTMKRAQAMQSKFNCKVYGLEQLKNLSTIGYDILINTTSVGIGAQEKTSLIPKRALIPKAIVLDMVYKPIITKLLRMAQAKKCRSITGGEVFINQAIAQDFLWL